MKIGVVFPQTEITADPSAVRDYAQAAESLGFTHLLVYDHVVGADLTNRPDFRGPYNIDSLFHEPFVLFGYLAAVTARIELVTGILIAPQRQTVLIAKQAAEVDVLSGGRLRLGLGIGWNDVEYTALGENFRDRGRRLDEQIDVLRELFSQKSVTFNGRYHWIDSAGIKPMPMQQSIPIWLGGSADVALRRAGEKADGWIPNSQFSDQTRDHIARFHRYATEAGRDSATLGIEARINVGNSTPDQWLELARSWQEVGATHLSINTMNAGLRSPAEHISLIERVKRVLDAIK